MAHNMFGGSWTDDKLKVLSEYLVQYRKILQKTNFETWFIDGFAGTGLIQKKVENELPLFEKEDQNIIGQYRKGSVTIALELNNPFDKYLFIEKDPDCYQELQNTISRYKHLNIETKCGDANEGICEWIDRVDHKNVRAVLFLDPYGMSVDWNTIERIAKSRIVDTWILFPLGSGVNRLLKSDGEIPLAWSQKLDRFFGTHDWYSIFYKESSQPSLFNDNLKKVKTADEEKIGYYFYNRLNSIFFKVTPSCGILQNEKGSNLFLLFFAASNERGAIPAINISSYLINRRFSNVYSFKN